MAKKNKKPYITYNPNDPRIQAYQDSLLVHNIYKDWVAYMHNPNTSADDFEEFLSSRDNYERNREGTWKNHNIETSNANDQRAEDAIKRLKKINRGMYSPTDFTSRSWGTILNDITMGLLGEGRIATLPIYEKPRQEVIYQPAPLQNTTITRKPINISELIPINANVATNVDTKTLAKDSLSKYKDLRMKSLWANMAKQNSSAIIGSLFNEVDDPNFEYGFTINEALGFPQEVKDGYNIDMIGNQVSNKNKFAKGGQANTAKKNKANSVDFAAKYFGATPIIDIAEQVKKDARSGFLNFDVDSPILNYILAKYSTQNRDWILGTDRGDIKVNDTRNRPASKKKSHNVNSELVRRITKESLRRGLDPSVTLAMALQESGMKSYNPFHLKGGVLRDTSEMEDSNNWVMDYTGIEPSIDFIVKKNKYAKRLGKTDEADIIQAFNGYGKLSPQTYDGGHTKKIYGQTGTIDMNKNPMYGKTVLALRDSAINTTPAIVKIVEEEIRNYDKSKNKTSNVEDIDDLTVDKQFALGGNTEDEKNGTIPLRYDEPLTFKDISKGDKTPIIDNYSKAFNYIIKGDKMYYSLKGKDHWVDISNNDYARKNLFTFIEDNYNYRGYSDVERSIGARIKNDTFNYTAYRDSANNAELAKQNVTLVPPVNKNDQLPITYNPNYDPSQEFNYNTPSQVAGANYIYRPAEVREEENGTVGLFNKLGDYRQLAVNGIRRKLMKNQKESTDPISSLELPAQDNIESKYGIRPSHYTGDTILYSSLTPKGIPNRYFLPESYDLNDVTLGVRNRYDRTPLETEGAIITTSHPFLPKEEYNMPNRNFMGIDSTGMFKSGNYNEFGNGDLVAPTYSNRVIDFQRNEDGSIKYSAPEEARQGNRKPAPLTTVIADKDGKYKDYATGKDIYYSKGDTIPGSMNLITWGNKGDANRYGSLTGGRVVLIAGDEVRLASGSINNVDKQIQDMKKRNNVGYVDVLTNDNGSYNLGFRTTDGKMSAEQLRRYDNLNTGFGSKAKYTGAASGTVYDPYGGNFLYIKDRGRPLEFKSDTVPTANIRNEKDESFLKGHSLINEQKGIVLHHTAFEEEDMSGAVERMRTRGPGHGAAHVAINYDGNRVVMANPNQVTFHAGESVWNGRDNVNDFMLGIEFQGNTANKPLTEAQINSAVEYMAPIIRENNIRLEDITTHKKVRDLYNEFAEKSKRVLGKIDIKESEYIRVIEALKQKIYYKK